MDTTCKALVDHWSWASEKGVMNKNTAAGIKSACSKVLSVLDDWQDKDVKDLDVEDTLRRFQNLKAKEFKPAVLETYKNRFRLAVTSYLAYLEDPGSWKATDRAPRQEKNGGGADNAEKQVVTTVTTRGQIPSSGLVDYPFPLRDGQIIRLVLPRDLKAAEVKRLTAFMSTLAVDSDTPTTSPDRLI